MTVLFWVLGSILIIGVTVDLIITTLESRGAGFITGPLTSGIWGIWKMLFCQRKPHFLNYSGLVVTLFVFSFWVLGLWCGFFLLYYADVNSVIETQPKTATDGLQKFYFAGYCLFTLGNGDLAPRTDLYRIVTTINSVSGLVFITLTITYLIPTLSAVTFKRQMAVYISNLGSDPVVILKNGWDGKQLKHLEPMLEDLNTMILMSSEQHLAYPILHYFHSNEQKYSAPLNLARLDEAMTIALNIFPKEALANPLLFKTVKQSLTEYSSTLETLFIATAEELPPADYGEKLQRHFPDLALNWSEAPFEETAERRKTLLKLVQNDCWEWKDVLG